MYQVNKLTVFRDGEQKPILSDFCFESNSCSCIAIVGKNGCGKTTLALSLIGLIPFHFKGNVKGEFLLDGTSIFQLSFQKRLDYISYVFQDVESQILFGNVKDILGLNENSGSHSIIYDLISILGVDNLLCKKPDELSSGEAQKIALISALRSNPELVIYDEATSSLDYRARIQFKSVIDYLHSIEKHVLLLGQNSRILNNYSNKTLYISDKTISDNPAIDEQSCFTYESLKRLLKNSFTTFNCISIKQLSFSYKRWTFSLEVNDFIISNGETIAIVGENGSGKSTFLNCINGFLHPKLFKMNISNREMQDLVFMAFSSPSLQFCGPTIKDELFRINPEIMDDFELIQNAFPFLDFNKDPFSLSFGEQKVLTFIQALFSYKPILILDEPELGLDDGNINFLSFLLEHNMKTKERTIIYATHDLNLAKSFSSRVLLFKEGKIAKDMPNSNISIEDWFTI